MKTRKAASLWFLILLIGLGGCATPGSSPTLGSGSTPGSNSISILPTSAAAGSSDITLTITGSNFAGARHNFSQAVWSVNGINTLLATTFDSSTQLAAVLPAALLTNPTTAQVFVQTGDPMGDVPFLKSISVAFPVTASSGPASISSISPTSAVAGSPDLTFTITGSNFDGAGVIRSRAVWTVNGSTTPLSTTFVAATQLTAVIPAALLGGPVEAQVAVQHYNHMEDVFDGISNSVSFSVSSAVAGSGAGMPSGFVLAGSMRTARSGHTATLLLSGKVLVTGGDVSGDAGGNASAELFDPVNGTFAPTGSMNTRRYGATATLLPNGKVLIAGGFGPGVSKLPRLNSAELYDPLAGTFGVTGSMTVGRVLHTATLLGNGKVLIAGGTDEGGGGGAAVGSAEIYDPAAGTFAATGSMISARAQHTATLLGGGEVLVTGGWNGHAADAADDPPWDPLFAELFDSSSGSFTTTGSMSTTRISHVAIRLANWKILMLGGIPSLQNLHEQPVDPQYAELYDPVAHTFSSAGTLTMSRTGYSATLLTNGKVLLAGGENLGQTVGTAELFDPTSDTLVATGEFVTARKGHTATLLNDGRVLVTGGVDSNGNALATAELYE